MYKALERSRERDAVSGDRKRGEPAAAAAHNQLITSSSHAKQFAVTAAASLASEQRWFVACSSARASCSSIHVMSSACGSAPL